ncbi:MAG: glycosyltransferase [Rhodospirillaceae bacterium BRH_c57]|nr:MAG: glycosyltransferase [Rhodospirillaceae bacterium BRH_c57]
MAGGGGAVAPQIKGEFLVKFVLFTHSLFSDWNHGNAHFLRGIVRALTARGHAVDVWEPADGWSRANLLADHGQGALNAIAAAFPDLRSNLYRLKTLDLDRVLDGADVVIVHEWSDPALVAAINRRRAGGAPWRLLFHDTHHRSASAPEDMAAYALDAFDGVLAFGETIRTLYERRGWGRRAWTWHEAADTSVFSPRHGIEGEGDLVWVGNWGDGERTAELTEFLIEPVRKLGLTARIHGVRYPEAVRTALQGLGIAHGGWLPNHAVPEVFAAHRVTVHVPRRFYATQLPGIPTIRVFEALACGIPLITAPWDDAEGLFRPGEDYLVAANGADMMRLLRNVLADPDQARVLAESGRNTILARHTCTHRVDELLGILADLRSEQREVA